jgi:hypothetical protein
MSIAIRFGRSRHNTFLKEHFGNHVTTELQLVCSHLVDEEIASTRNAQVFARLEEATRRPFASGLERYRELQKLFTLLGAELSPQTFIEHAWRGHAEAAQERYVAEMHEARLRRGAALQEPHENASSDGTDSG